MTDAYHHIYDGEIFQKSQCIWHENVMMDFFRSQLIHRGYQRQDSSSKVWRRGHQQVVVCLVDDITTCTGSTDPYIPEAWDADTVIITDNIINCPVRYKVHTLPNSFFGIYYYEPQARSWHPDRRFNFAVNRIDLKRVSLFLEYRKRLPWEPNRDVMDYVNFNCWVWDGDNTTPQGLRSNFERTYDSLVQKVRDVHQITKDTDIPEMPWRNHDLDPENSMHRAWINMVIETYSSDTVIALSEKTFRALVTPVPWMLYSGRYTVTYLESLGFDCLSDVINHGYDRITELNTMDYGDKLVDWWWQASETAKDLHQLDFAELEQRCARAAKHNQEKLAQMRQRWPSDFAAWWQTVSAAIN